MQNCTLNVEISYFGETPEGTGQAEDYRLKLSPRKASQQYIIKNPKMKYYAFND
jgi:hypothetical protein